MTYNVFSGTLNPTHFTSLHFPPQYSVHFCCGQMTGCIKMPLGTKVGHSPGDFVLHGDPAPLPKRGSSSRTQSHVYCGQTAGWIKMALGMEVGLGPGHIVLDGDPAKKGGRAPTQFSVHFIVAKRLHGSRCHLVWR